MRTWHEVQTSMRRRKLQSMLCDNNSYEVRGTHRMCPGREYKWATGSSYDALFLDEQARVCCRECGATDLVMPRMIEAGLA